MLLRFFICTQFLLSSLTLLAEVVPDSLRGVIEASERDTNQLNAIHEYISIISQSDAEKAYDWCLIALERSVELQSLRHEIKAYSGAAYHSCILNNPGRADSLLRAAMRRAVQNDNPEYIARVYNRLGATYSFYGVLDSMRTNYRKAFQLYNNIGKIATAVDCYGNLSMAYYRVGIPDSAKKYNSICLEICDREDFIGRRAKALNTIGIILREEGLYMDALNALIECMSISQKLGNMQSAAYASGNIGLIYQELRRNSEAFTYYNRTAQILDSLGVPVGVANSYSNLALLFDDSLEAAMEIRNESEVRRFLNIKYNFLEKARKIYQEERDEERIITIYGCKSSMYIQVAKYFKKLDAKYNTEESVSNQNDYYHVFLDSAKNEAMIAQEIIDRTNSLRNKVENNLLLYQIAFEEKRYNDALSHVVLADSMSKITKMNSQFVRIHENYTHVYSVLGKADLSIKHLKIYIEFSDSMAQSRSVQDLGRLEAKLIYNQQLAEQKEKEKRRIEKGEQEKSRFRMIIIFLATITLMIIVFAITLSKRLTISKYQNEIILKQKSEVEIQEQLVQVKNAELELQKIRLNSSIRSAHKIQQAILPSENQLSKLFQDYMILMLPKDVVSGDYYWCHSPSKNEWIWSVVDCTGHGVPGGFMSMMGNALMNDIIIKGGQMTPSEIIYEVDHEISRSFGAETSNKDEVYEGLELGIVHYNEAKSEITYAGTSHPLVILRDNELIELNSSRFRIACGNRGKIVINDQKFTVKKNDLLYMFSDGIVDQFGGPDLKKFGKNQLRELLHSVSQAPPSAQAKIVHEALEKWQADHRQIDDILVMGIRI